MEKTITETHLRSIAKGVCYRAGAVLQAASVAWWISGDFQSGLNVGMFVLVAGFIMYYLHERIWVLTGKLRDSWDGYEFHKRSMIKTITYRAIVLGVAFGTGKLLVSSDNVEALQFAIYTNLINICWYYIIERLFNLTRWGVKV